MTDFLTSLTEIATTIGDMLVSLFTSVSAVFYTPASTASDGSTTAGSLTFIGILAVMVLFIGLALALVNWVRGLIARR